MNTAEGIPSTIDPKPDDGEPPSLGTNRSWESAWQIDPFTKDKAYTTGIENLQLLDGQTDEDKTYDEQVTIAHAMRRAQIEHDYFNPAPKEKVVTGPQRIMGKVVTLLGRSREGK